MNLLRIGGENFSVRFVLQHQRNEPRNGYNCHPIAALFLYRRNHRLVLIYDDANDLNAVRINIPLSRVDSLEKTNMLSFAGLISVTFDPKSSNGASNVASAEYPTPSTEGKEDFSLLETAPDKQILQLAVLRKDFDWDNVMTIINKAKTSASEGDVDWPGSRVYIDVDPRAGESSGKSDNNLSDLVKSVSFALGLDTSKEIWSTSYSFLSSLSSHSFFQSRKPTSIAPL
jgi:hypothetical protein